MEEAILFVEANQAWIYLLLALAGGLYLRQVLRSYRQRRETIFALERERTTGRLRASAAMLGTVLGLMLVTFLVSTFAAPAIPASIRPTALPTLSLLPTATLALVASGEQLATATPLPAVTVDSAGCQNPVATVTAPANGDSLSGVVEVAGTANIENFAFYKLEYISLVPGAVWRAVWAGTTPVVDDQLGTWDTSLVIPGDYAFRLVVTDAAGNAPLPCMLQVRVQAAA
ncbi:MAG: hypothetical protein MUO23_09760 [Anaerolineales bacterium]|nr:hypothetical protein [Anaerolineales bacterium]